MRATLIRSFTFQAAHRLPSLPQGHKCRRVHGHTYRVDVAIEDEVDPASGMVMDFADMTAVARPVLEELDHRCLNDIEGLANPTSEVLAKWLWERLKPRLPALSCITVKESPAAQCLYRGE